MTSAQEHRRALTNLFLLEGIEPDKIVDTIIGASSAEDLAEIVRSALLDEVAAEIASTLDDLPDA